VRQLNGTIVQLPSGEAYDDIAQGAWNLYNTRAEPACIVVPTHAAHVQAAMKAIFDSGGVRYAVQAGGHSAGQDWNTVGSDGILISFSAMAAISYSPTKDTITLQPGVRWGDAVTQMEPFGVAPMGGRLPHVGTGLLLGGGLSYLSGRHGFSVDALVEADVVLVSGRTVTATRTNQHADLFRALKGGANRFGIVTRYEVKAIHVGRSTDKRFWGGAIVFDNSTSGALMQATANYIEKVSDPGASLLMIFGATFANATPSTVNMAAFYYQGAGNASAIYSDFLALPSVVSQVGNASFVEAMGTLGTADGAGFGQQFGASAFGSAAHDRAHGIGAPAHAARYTNALRRFHAFVDAVKARGVAQVVFAFTPVLQSQVRAGRAAGGNAIDPPLSSYHLIQFHVSTSPTASSADRAAIEDARRAFMQGTPPSPGLPLYINECDTSQNVFSTYGGYEFLKRTYAKYDPTRFNVRYTTGPVGL